MRIQTADYLAYTTACAPANDADPSPVYFDCKVQDCNIIPIETFF